MLSFIVLVVNLAFSYGANPCAFQALSMHFGNGCNEKANYRPGGEIVEGAINMANSLLTDPNRFWRKRHVEKYCVDELERAKSEAKATRGTQFV